MSSPVAVLSAARAAAAQPTRAQIAALRRVLAAYDAAASDLYDADARALVGATGRVRLSPQQGRLFAALARVPGRLVPTAALVDAMVGEDRDDGGPAAAQQQLRVMLCRLRRALARCGSPARIVSVWGGGYRLDIHQIGAQFDARPRGRASGASSPPAASVE